MQNKKGLAIENLGKWVIGLAVLVIVLLVSFTLSEKGQNAIAYIKNLLT